MVRPEITIHSAASAPKVIGYPNDIAITLAVFGQDDPFGGCVWAISEYGEWTTCCVHGRACSRVFAVRQWIDENRDPEGRVKWPTSA